MGSPSSQSEPRGRDLGAAALVLLAVIWGYHWVVMKIGLSYADPFTFAALRTLSAGPAGLGTLAIPVVGVVAAWLQLGEVPTAVEGVGMALIVGALAILAARGLVAGRRQPPPADEVPLVQPVTD